MIKPLIVVNPTLRLPFVAQLFSRFGIQNAIVIEEHELVGVISSSDLVTALDNLSTGRRSMTPAAEHFKEEVMEFGWTEEQTMWRKAVRDFAQKKIAPRCP